MLCYNVFNINHKTMWRQNGGKYNVAPKEQRTLGGRVFDSKREAQVAQELEALLKAKEILELEYQPRVELIPKPNRITYVPDFRVVWRNGNEEYIDVKGMETDVFKLKAKLFAYIHPKKKLVIMK